MFWKNKNNGDDEDNYDTKAYFRKKMRENIYQNENFPLGLLKGILFSLIGVLAWILLGFLGFMTSLASLLIGELFYRGLKTEYVIIDRRRMTLIVMYTILVSMIATYIEIGFSRMINNDISFFSMLFVEMPSAIVNNYRFAASFFRRMFNTLIFSSLGAFFIYRRVSRDI